MMDGLAGPGCWMVHACGSSKRIWFILQQYMRAIMHTQVRSGPLREGLVVLTRVAVGCRQGTATPANHCT